MIEIETNTKDNIHHIFVKGDVDASSSIHLDNALEEALEKGHSRILVDLNQLEYISSAGLGVFISRLDEIKSKEVKMVLHGMSDSVSQVFKILGLEKLLIITDSKEEALEVINEA